MKAVLILMLLVGQSALAIMPLEPKEYFGNGTFVRYDGGVVVGPYSVHLEINKDESRAEYYEFIIDSSLSSSGEIKIYISFDENNQTLKIFDTEEALVGGGYCVGGSCRLKYEWATYDVTGRPMVVVIDEVYVQKGAELTRTGSVALKVDPTRVLVVTEDVFKSFIF